MFKGIVIELTGPICSCEKQDLSWGITGMAAVTPADKYGLSFTIREGKTGLVVQCLTCKTKLDIPYDQFKAGFKLDAPYPANKPKPAPEAKPKLDCLPGGKVISLPEHDPKKEGPP